MATVLIEGTERPAVDLPRGHQRHVQYSDYVQKLVDRGNVRILEWYDDEPEELPEPEPIGPTVEPPARNASRDDWAEFLALHPAGFVTDGKTRETLIGEWDNHLRSLELQAAEAVEADAGS